MCRDKFITTIRVCEELLDELNKETTKMFDLEIIKKLKEMAEKESKNELSN